MPGCNLSGPIDNSLSSLSSLSVIDLSFNLITYYPLVCFPTSTR
uniref:Uncharacterized protein n=1 Tax=Arundo donax TaxID=35708 RepID=A0A0A8ZU78_ARUDO